MSVIQPVTLLSSASSGPATVAAVIQNAETAAVTKVTSATCVGDASGSARNGRSGIRNLGPGVPPPKGR